MTTRPGDPPHSVGDITRDGGTVIALIHDPDFVNKWRQAERIHTTLRDYIFELLEKSAADHSEVQACRWEEAARLAGYESIEAMNTAGDSLVIQYGTREIVVIRQKAV